MGIYAVSGSASGIGLALRTRLERRGHQVIGVDLRDAEVVADLATVAGRAAAVAEVLMRCGGHLDGLCSAAGLGVPGDARRIAAVNFFGSRDVLLGLKSALLRSGDAQVVMVSSNSIAMDADIPDALVNAMLADDEALARDLAAAAGDSLCYIVSKLAIARYVRQNAAAWAGAGIRLNAIAPGATDTPLLAGGLADRDLGARIKALPIPEGRFLAADEIAAWIEQMLIGDGRRALVGTVLFVDGGTDAYLNNAVFRRAIDC